MLDRLFGRWRWYRRGVGDRWSRRVTGLRRGEYVFAWHRVPMCPALLHGEFVGGGLVPHGVCYQWEDLGGAEGACFCEVHPTRAPRVWPRWSVELGKFLLRCLGWAAFSLAIPLTAQGLDRLYGIGMNAASWLGTLLVVLVRVLAWCDGRLLAHERAALSPRVTAPEPPR